MPINREKIINKWLKVPYTLHVELLSSPKKPKATLVLLHGIGSSSMMWSTLIKKMPADTKVIALDLLGFGLSPQPVWKHYSTKTQAESVHKSLAKHVGRKPIIMVGHSLGSLVAIEYAYRYPKRVSRLVLISPPLYKPISNRRLNLSRDARLRQIYRLMISQPKRTEQVLRLTKYIFERLNNITTTRSANLATFLATLDAAIIQQRVWPHLEELSLPITMISGTRDGVVIKKNLDEICAQHHNVTHVRVKKAGHNVVGTMRDATSKVLLDILT